MIRTSMFATVLLPLGIAFSLSVGACESDDDTKPEPVDCTTVTQTYENFGAAFMADYCASCHSSSLVGDTARSSAPASINFDDQGDVQDQKGRIKGSAGLTTKMPPSSAPNKPTAAERANLVKWLECEAK